MIQKKRCSVAVDYMFVRSFAGINEGHRQKEGKYGKKK